MESSFIYRAGAERTQFFIRLIWARTDSTFILGIMVGYR